MKHEDQHILPRHRQGRTLSRPRNARGRDGMTNPEDFMRDDAPTYTDADQGTDQDRDARAGATVERASRHERNRPDRAGLIGQLNDRSSGLGGMVDYLRGKTGNPDERPAGHIPRVVIYLRVSTEEQATMGGEAEGYSIPYQRDACLGKVRQLGGILAAEFVDAGESAKSAHRPQLQKMLRELKAKRIDYVLVHKIDRLARNRADDVEINAAIARSGPKLISVAEPVDETPAGKLLYNMMADVAQYHSDNLAVEVLKGMDTKAKRGGTPYRAPLGYLNRKEFIDNARHSYVIIDEERAPLIRWAFEQYALGNWAIRQLVDALNAQGLRSRASRKLTAKPLTISGVHHMLRNPYYMGVVPYRGVYHEGKHEPLVSVELWLRVQDVLTAHHLAGEKERKTLEALLYTPTTDRELFTAKLLGAWVTAVAVTLLSFVVYAVMANAAGWQSIGHIFFPNWMWIVLVFWVTPAVAGLGLVVMVFVSMRAQGFQDAYQTGGMVVLPVLLLMIGQISGVMYFSVGVALFVGLVIWLLDIVLLWFASKSFRRGELMTKF